MMHLVAVVFLSLLTAAEQSRQRIGLQGQATSQQGGALDLFLLPEGKYEGGKCMDGSQAGYYYGPPSSGSSTLWVIFLRGGGGCETKTTCQQWYGKAGPHGGKMGGSAGWDSPLFVDKVGSKELSSDSEKNPDFHDAHHVFVPYCTGDSHLGQISNPTEADNFGYFFDGHLNVKAIVEDLRAKFPAAASMQRVLFQGHSAGGRGAFVNCDFLQDQLGASVSVWCNPQSTWFPGNIQEGADPDSPPTSFESWSGGSLDPVGFTKQRPNDGYRHEGCVAALGAEAELCDSMHVLYQYIKAPIYVIMDMFDTAVLRNVAGNVPQDFPLSPKGREYVAYIGNCTKSSMTQITNHPQGKVGDGYFLPACFDHGSNPDLGDGFSKADGLGDWFFGRDVVPRVLIAECASIPPYLPCTAGCTHLPPDCQATLQHLCGDAEGKGPCLECAKANQKPLGKAGCDKSLVITLCGN